MDDRRELNRGFGDTLAKAFELIATPALFGVAGWFLDRWLGTAPLFTVVFVVLATVGKVVALWYHYVARMEQLEAALPSRRLAASGPVAPPFRSPEPSGQLPTGVTLEAPTAVPGEDT